MIIVPLPGRKDRFPDTALGELIDELERLGIEVVKSYAVQRDTRGQWVGIVNRND